MQTNAHYNSHDEINIVVHVDEELDERHRQRVEHAMQTATGIGQAYFDDFRRHLLIIGYNPARIDSARILALVKQQRLTAELIVGI